MKKTVNILLVVILILAACKDGTSFKHQKAETVLTLTKYVVNNQVFEDLALRIIKDSLITTLTDSTSEKVVTQKKWVRDTQYHVPYMDTLREKGLVVLDSLGKAQPRLIYVYLPKKKHIVFDWNWRPDSTGEKK